MPKNETVLEQLTSQIVKLALTDASKEHWLTVKCLHWIEDILIEQEHRLKALEHVIGTYKELE